MLISDRRVEPVKLISQTSDAFYAIVSDGMKSNEVIQIVISPFLLSMPQHFPRVQCIFKLKYLALSLKYTLTGDGSQLYRRHVVKFVAFSKLRV